MKELENFVKLVKKELNVNIIDEKTGKNFLDLIAENIKEENCLNCKWMDYGDGITGDEEDTICYNADSEHWSGWVSDDMVCKDWEKIDGKDE